MHGKPTYLENTTASLYDESYYAYLLMFDANNISERKKLLKSIIKTPDIAVLFNKNFKPNKWEKEITIKSILEDIDACYKYLTECNPMDSYRKNAFEMILNDPEYCYKTVQSNILNEDEIKLIYNKYQKKYFEMSGNNYIEYCLLFKNYISKLEKQKLVEVIYSTQDKLNAKKVLNEIQLSETLIDILESILIIDNLSG